MTQTRILYWIKENLAPVINKALKENEGVIYTEDWLAAMAYRETGFLIARYADKKMSPDSIHSIIKGDYGRRDGELEKQYHGFGYWQIDIGSYPEFVKSGQWKDPYLTCMKAIHVLEEKRKYLAKRVDIDKIGLDTYHRAITAAYNCGQGNVMRAIEKGVDVDRYTHQGDYSKVVWSLRDAYKLL